MGHSELFNLVLGGCAIWYSFLPAGQIRQYRRPVVLWLRLGGAVLMALAAISLLVKAGRQS